MNVIFIDFDGAIYSIHHESEKDVERRVSILGDICKECNAKVVIESSMKDAIDEETLETDSKYINFLFSLFKKYGIECIGRTPTINRRLNSYSYISDWKEDEIRLYLYRHLEIDHYCVIDDDDLYPTSDLDKVRDHLVKTIYYSNNYDEEGLLPKHKEEVKEKLEIENEVKKLVLKRKNK